MEHSVVTIVCLLLGAALIALGVWERLGKGPNARAWTDAATETRVRMALFILPGLGLLALVFGLAPWLDDVPVLVVLYPFLLLVGVLGLFVWGFLQVPYPRWSVPGWAREKVARRFGKEKWLQ